MTPISVLVVDDKAEMLHALAELVEVQADFRLAGAAGGVDEAIDIARRTNPTVALVDFKMPDGGGPRLARELRSLCPDTRVVALSAHDDRWAAFEMIRAGAIGYLVKGVEASEIVRAIRQAAAGLPTLSSGIAADVLKELAQKLDETASVAELQHSVIDRLNTLIGSQTIKTVYQPIVDLELHHPIGFESLTRFPGAGVDGPASWFADAAAVGLGVELEQEALRVGLAAGWELPVGCFLSVNLSPAAILSDPVLELLEANSPERLVLEITEHARIDDYNVLARRLSPLRSLGLRIAVDDAGAGYASLRHLLEIHPDMIKLDVALTHAIDEHIERRALAEALIAFSRSTNTMLVAEGIETAGEERALRELGVRYGQGYHLGAPAPRMIL